MPNNGDMHVIERIHLADKDILHVDLEIFAPQILTKPWKITRIFFRQRARKYDIVDFETGFDIAQRVLMIFIRQRWGVYVHSMAP